MLVSKHWEWPIHLLLKEDISNAYPWVTLLQRIRHLCRLPLHADSYVCCLQSRLIRNVGRHDGQRIVYSTVLSGCMCACEHVCGIRCANGAYAYQCYDTFRGAMSTSYTSYVSCALSCIILWYYFFWNTSHSLTNSSINHRLSKRFDCENCNTKTNFHSHLLWYIYWCQAIADLILPVIGLHYHLPQHVI